MSDPSRLLDVSGDEASLLSAGMEMDPPADAKARVWNSLSVSLGVSALAAGTTSVVASEAAASTSVASGLGTNAIAGSGASGAVGAGGSATGIGVSGGGLASLGSSMTALLIGTLVVGGGAFYWATRAPAMNDVSQVAHGNSVRPALTPLLEVRSATTEGDRGAGSSLSPAAPSDGRATQSAAHGSASKLDAPRAAKGGVPQGPAVDRPLRAPTASDPSAIREESAALSRARLLLRQGNASAALVALQEMSAKFPRPSLAQERQALQIEALAASGQGALAAKQAEAFLAAYPKSALCDRIRGYAR